MKNQTTQPSMAQQQRTAPKLDRGLNLALFETVQGWRQTNGVRYDDYTRYRQSIDAVRPLTKQMKILGEYKEGKSTVQ